MIDIKKLEEERNKAYDVWFERWWRKENIEGKIKARNGKGYTELFIPFYGGHDDYVFNRLKDSRIVGKIKDKLPGFSIRYTEGRSILRNQYYQTGIEIRWK